MMTTSTNFMANPVLASGTNRVTVIAQNGGGHATTNNFSVPVPPTATITPTYDANGNEMNNGNGEIYAYDAENRLLTITYASGAIGNFTYNALGQRVQMIEKNSGGTVTSTKNLIWCGATPCEERDATNTVTKRLYDQGEQIGGASYYYTRDHLGSIRELTDISGTIQARYDYDPYGRMTKVQGTTVDSDFQYAGMYVHQPSNLNLTLFRAYDPNAGRWLSRDPIGIAGGLNLYGYVGNDPIKNIDPLGLDTDEGGYITVSNGYGEVTVPAGNVHIEIAADGSATVTTERASDSVPQGQVGGPGYDPQVADTAGGAIVGGAWAYAAPEAFGGGPVAPAVIGGMAAGSIWDF